MPAPRGNRCWGLAGALLSDGLTHTTCSWTTRRKRRADGALEPILLVRGSDGGWAAARDATWQRALGPHWLVNDSRGARPPIDAVILHVGRRFMRAEPDDPPHGTSSVAPLFTDTAQSPLWGRATEHAPRGRFASSSVVRLRVVSHGVVVHVAPP